MIHVFPTINNQIFTVKKIKNIKKFRIHERDPEIPGQWKRKKSIRRKRWCWVSLVFFNKELLLNKKCSKKECRLKNSWPLTEAKSDLICILVFWLNSDFKPKRRRRNKAMVSYYWLSRTSSVHSFFVYFISNVRLERRSRAHWEKSLRLPETATTGTYSRELQ